MENEKKTFKNKADEIAQQLAEKYIQSMEKGEIPWRKPWRINGIVCNGASGRHYRGINRLWLEAISEDRGYTDPRFYTFYEIQKHFKEEVEKSKSNLDVWSLDNAKGMGVKVLYFSYYDTKERKALNMAEYLELYSSQPEYVKEYIRTITKTSTVFNAAHIKGLKPLELNNTKEIKQDFIQLQFLETLIKNMEIEFHEVLSSDEAFYSPSQDSVTVPARKNFISFEEYMSTVLHELGHGTGHQTRLDRKMFDFFGTEEYAKEELRADIGSMLVMKRLNPNGVSSSLDKNHLAYIQSWIKKIREQPKELKDAIIDAQKILDYVEEKGNLEKYLKLSEVVETIKSSVHERLGVFMEENNLDDSDWFELNQCVQNVYEELDESVLLNDDFQVSNINKEIDEELEKQFSISKSLDYML